PRRSETLAKLRGARKFWEPESDTAAQHEELDRQRHAMDKEMADTLRELLGPDAYPPDTAREWKLAELDQKLSFLPADKRAETRALLLRNDANDALIKSLSEANRPTENADELAGILQTYDDKRAELRRLLTPEEFDQLEYSVSWTADNLRRA